MFGRTKESLFIQQPTFQKTDLGGKFNIAIYIITFYNYITDIYYQFLYIYVIEARNLLNKHNDCFRTFLRETVK